MINTWREVNDVINKLVQKVEDLYRQVMYTNSSQIGNQTTVDGDATFNGLVTIRAPKILCLTSGNEPTDSDASGVFMSAAGETFGEDTYNIGGVENGGLQFGIRSTDGVGVFSGGDATIGADGIEINRMGYLLAHTATDGTTERTGSLGMWATPGGTAPQYGIAFNAPGGSELVTNGDAETNDLTGWTQVGGSENDWYVEIAPYLTNTYAFSWLSSTTSSLEQNGISVTENTNYIFSIMHTRTGGSANVKCELKWYDSGSSLLRTDIIFNNTGIATTPVTNNLTVTSPLGALTVDIVLTVYTGTDRFRVDNISLKAVSVASNLYFDSTGELNLNDDPLLPIYCYISSLVMTSSATLSTIAGNPAYKRTTAANASNGNTFTIPVPQLSPGTYSIYFCGAKQSDRGKLDWTLDGASIVTGQDWYGTQADYVYQVDNIIIGNGTHELVGTINGKNASSTGYTVVIYSWIFVKTA